MATGINESATLRFEQKSGGFAAVLLATYVFMLYSRAFEASQLVGIPNLYLMLILSAVGLLTVTLRGDLVRAAKTPVGVTLITFTLWAIAILPFSSWKGESLRQLSGVWLKSLAAFFIIVGLTRSLGDIKKTIAALGWGAAISTLLIVITARRYGERATSFGSFSNSNEMAFHLVLGLPFLVLLASRSKLIPKILLALIALVSVAQSLKTASRGGLIMAAALVFVALLKVSFANKAKIIAIVGVAGVLGLMTVDDTAMERYKTIFMSDSSSAEAMSARESADSRKELLKMSIDLTIAHPLFGVGMGDFPSAAAELQKDRGQHQLWQVTHNSYTQISCETGVIGLLIMLSAFAASLAGLWKIDRQARSLGLMDISNLALSMLLSFVVLMVHFSFDALAYDFYFPLIAGVSTALIYSARPVLDEAEAKLRSPVIENAPADIPVVQFSPQLAGVAVGGSNAATQNAEQNARPPQAQASHQPIQSGNPYRIGRKRNNLPR